MIRLSLLLLTLTTIHAQTDKPASKPIVSQFSGHTIPTQDHPLSPAEAANTFKVPDDLEIEQVLAEPIVRQPVFLNFDERGRMWVVQYLQYPAPAGLKEVSRDKFWRAVYDKVPEPPPRGVKGLDKITIHEDTNGDGVFDKHKTFVDGLNIATACVKGRGGVWVLNPPYLLFYPDKNDDDVPDGDPVVHLAGFGLEDTHSVVNSLRWGPDGWLYAAQGSTVTANVRVVAPGSPDTNTVHYSQGQNIWRYHPERHIYEIFAEGGGNAFGVEFDDKGRLFSGHNGGDTRGFHYMQGAYLRKGFEKHGELSNPYAFGYFPQMDGTKGERFTHNFIIYHGGALPQRYDGKLFGVEPLQGRVVLSDIMPDGSTFKTRDIERVVTSSDSWFRPVDIKVGPDGAIYIADWYDRQVTHTRNQEGHIDKEHGRIYRLKKKGAKPLPPFDLGKLPAVDLVKLLGNSNSWMRHTTVGVLRDRHRFEDLEVVRRWYNRIASTVQAPTPDPADNAAVKRFDEELALQPYFLDYFWALLALTPNPTTELESQLNSTWPDVQVWAIRLLGDANRVSSFGAQRLSRLAADDGDIVGSARSVEVRAQLACAAKRLPAKDALPIVANLLGYAKDAKDPRLPLLCWWAIESKCESDRDSVLKLFEDSPFWNLPMVEQHLLERIMRRFAAAGTRKDLLTCAKLLQLSPSRAHSVKLMAGFEEAFKGRSLTGLPDELVAAMARHNVGSDAFKLRTGDTPALARALSLITDSSAAKKRRQEFIEVLGEVRPREALDPLLRVADNERDPPLRKSALSALRGYDDARIAATVVKDYNDYAAEVRTAALALVSSRAAWALAFAEAVDAGHIRASAVPLDAVRQWQRHKSDRLAALIPKLWPNAGRPTSEAMQQQIRHLAGVIRSGEGDPYNGQKLFNATCASCHTLFARGGKVGPDLTTYQRGDLDTMLVHVVNPSAEIREGYENILIETKDERSLTGFLVERDARVVVLRGPDGQNITLEQSNITEMKAAGLSLMPEGLLDGLSEQQVRDLFAYLRSTQPLAN
jgi:putative membrane-bound dehydrogenase-like protein